jgi:hypothetical protein
LWASGLGRVAQGLLAWWFPDSSMRGSVRFMVGIRVVLGMVVGPVFGSGVPVVAELVLRAMASEPPDAHIHHLDPAGDNHLVDNTCSG